jgi:CDP-diacylglycerol--serine O-phosphatidyltransferase
MNRVQLPGKLRNPIVKRIAVLPTLLTLGNAVCGFASIAWASKIDLTADINRYFAVSGWFIVAAMVFDALDGYVARLAKSTSNFGVQLDSLCDVVSFGVAPAYLVLRMGPGWERAQLHRTLLVIGTLYLLCAILRLARFNVETSPDPSLGKRFRGLPSPGAAGCIAALSIVRGEFAASELAQKIGISPDQVRVIVEIWAPLGAFLVALLMVSRLPYPHMTKQILRGRKPFRHLMQIIVVGCIVVLVPDLAIVCLFWGYALTFPLRYLLSRAKPNLDRPSNLS